MRNARRIAGLVGWLTVLAAIVALVAPKLLGYDRYVIVSGSMHGTFDRGSVVFSKPTPVSQLKVGDVITYMPPAATGVNHLVSHRIHSIQVADDGLTRVFRTKGDANPGEDPWTFALNKPTENVMRFSVPVVGYALLALADAHIRMLLVGVPAALIALGSLFDLLDISLRVPRRRVQAA
jgi:signal peptidase I